jgi:hypothetical protein
MVLQRNAIDEYAQANGGRLPLELSEIAEPDPDITMERLDRGYLLTAKAGKVTLRLSNTMNTDSFLGNSLRTLRAKQ